MNEFKEFEADIIVEAAIRFTVMAHDRQEARKQVLKQIKVIEDELLKMGNAEPDSRTIKFTNLHEKKEE